MRKVICIAMALMFVCSMAFAGELSVTETAKKIPALKQGMAYSIADSEFCYLSTIEILNKCGVSLEAGYSSKDKAVVVVSYKLLELKDYVNVPLLDLLEANIGAYYGFGRIDLGINDRDNMEGNNESDYGLSLTLLKVKF
jgi:hypothetical protein